MGTLEIVCSFSHPSSFFSSVSSYSSPSSSSRKGELGGLFNTMAQSALAAAPQSSETKSAQRVLPSKSFSPSESLSHRRRDPRADDEDGLLPKLWL